MWPVEILSFVSLRNAGRFQKVGNRGSVWSIYSISLFIAEGMETIPRSAEDCSTQSSNALLLYYIYIYIYIYLFLFSLDKSFK